MDEFVQNTFDYIICGGGTAGLVLAARLSEIPDAVVGVIEAGKDRLEDPNILTPLLFSTLLSNPEYDWMYQTAPQVRCFRLIFIVNKGVVLTDRFASWELMEEFIQCQEGRLSGGRVRPISWPM